MGGKVEKLDIQVYGEQYEYSFAQRLMHAAITTLPWFSSPTNTA